jgi:peptidoglycan/LPS O-acetylase OafA/YrhL
MTTVTTARRPDIPEKPAATTKKLIRRLDTLTGMRFFAALAVVLCHVGATFNHNRWVTTATSYGYIGVSFFFLLSGFVLTWSAGHRDRQPGAGRFLWLRFARVWPAQFVLVLIAFTVLAGQELLPGTLGKVSEVLLLQSWTPDQTVYFGGNGVSWSLSCEMFFYLAFPFVLPLLTRLRGRGLAVTAGATVAGLVAAPLLGAALGASANLSYWLFFVFPPYRFGEFLLGMVAARAVLLGWRIRRPAAPLLAGALGLAALVAALTWYTVRGGVVDRPYVALLALPLFGLLVFGGTNLDLAGRSSWLNRGLAVKLGDWSYALYLVHKPLFLATLAWGWWTASGGVVGAADCLCLIVLAVALGAGVHVLIEKPVEGWLRKLSVGTLKHYLTTATGRTAVE